MRREDQAFRDATARQLVSEMQRNREILRRALAAYVHGGEWRGQLTDAAWQSAGRVRSDVDHLDDLRRFFRAAHRAYDALARVMRESSAQRNGLRVIDPGAIRDAIRRIGEAEVALPLEQWDLLQEEQASIAAWKKRRLPA